MPMIMLFLGPLPPSLMHPPLMLLPAVQFILARPWPGNLAQKARANGRTLLISDIIQVLVLVEQMLVQVVLVQLLLVQQTLLIGDIMQVLEVVEQILVQVQGVPKKCTNTKKS